VRHILPPDCTCDGKTPWCPACLVSAVIVMRLAHPDTLSISMLKRRVPRITGREAALLLEATKSIHLNGKDGRH